MLSTRYSPLGSVRTSARPEWPVVSVVVSRTRASARGVPALSVTRPLIAPPGPSTNWMCVASGRATDRRVGGYPAASTSTETPPSARSAKTKRPSGSVWVSSVSVVVQ
jgi:hypothetical protein